MNTPLTQHEAFVLFSAMKYQLSQNSYGASIISQEIIRNIPRLPFHEVDKFFSEIMEHQKEGKINKNDAPIWDGVTKALWKRLNQPYDLPAVR